MIFQISMWHNVTYTPAGMAVTLIGEDLGCVCAVFFASTYLSLYASLCIYISAFLKDASMMIAKIDQLVPQLPRSQTKMKLTFINMFELHRRAIE